MPQLLLPRIVTSGDADFSRYPELGLASLLLESGYEDAEVFVTALKDLLAERTVFRLLELFMVFASPSIAVCAGLFGSLISNTQSDTWLPIISRRAPDFTSGMPDLLASIVSANASNYLQITSWFGYSDFDYELLIDNPNAFIDWVLNAEVRLAPAINNMRAADVSGFIAEVVILYTGQDLRDVPAKWAKIRRWVNLAFTQYAFGSSIEQTWWL